MEGSPIVDIAQRITEANNLTPTEQALAQRVLDLGERLQGYSIKELAAASSASIASIHRLCKKLGLEGFKELKVEMARSTARRGTAQRVDINFPFKADDRAHDIVPVMESLYQTTIRDIVEVLDPMQLDLASRIIDRAGSVELYTSSHNVHPARMFAQRLLSAGKRAEVLSTWEDQIRVALASDKSHAAVVISYSGLAPFLPDLLPALRERHVPVILVGSKRARHLHAGLAAYLMVGDREALQNRITQFSSHIAVQFVLDSLFSCVFARDYDERMAFLKRSVPYTALAGVGWSGEQRGAGFAAEPSAE